MSVLVVGSMAFDSVETPAQSRENVIGGSAVFCGYAASYFSPVRWVDVVGEDWPVEFTQLLKTRSSVSSHIQPSGASAGGTGYCQKGGRRH